MTATRMVSGPVPLGQNHSGSELAGRYILDQSPDECGASADSVNLRPVAVSFSRARGFLGIRTAGLQL